MVYGLVSCRCLSIAYLKDVSKCARQGFCVGCMGCLLCERFKGVSEGPSVNGIMSGWVNESTTQW